MTQLYLLMHLPVALLFWRPFYRYLFYPTVWKTRTECINFT